MKNNLFAFNLRPPIFFRFYLLASALTLAAACSTANKQQDERSESGSTDLSQAQALENQEFKSSVTIDYELGRDHYLFQVISQKSTITVKSYLDKHLLKEGPIVPDKYLVFLNKANRFMDIPRTLSAKNRLCRGPFTITIKSGDSTKTAKGCRSDDEGSLSRLIREGEFLLYSGN